MKIASLRTMALARPDSAAPLERSPTCVLPSALLVRRPSPLATSAMRAERHSLLQQAAAPARAQSAPAGFIAPAARGEADLADLALQYLALRGMAGGQKPVALAAAELPKFVAAFHAAEDRTNDDASLARPVFNRPAAMPVGKALHLLSTVKHYLPRQLGMDFRTEEGRAMRAIARESERQTGVTEPQSHAAAPAASAGGGAAEVFGKGIAERVLARYDQVLQALDDVQRGGHGLLLPAWPEQLVVPARLTELHAALGLATDWSDLFAQLVPGSAGVLAGDEQATLGIPLVSRQTLEHLLYLQQQLERHEHSKAPPRAGTVQGIRRARHIDAPRMVLLALFGED